MKKQFLLSLFLVVFLVPLYPQLKNGLYRMTVFVNNKGFQKNNKNDFDKKCCCSEKRDLIAFMLAHENIVINIIHALNEVAVDAAKISAALHDIAAIITSSLSIAEKNKFIKMLTQAVKKFKLAHCHELHAD